MKLLEMMGLVGIGYILKDHGAFYPRRRSYPYQENKLKRLLTDKITDGIERLLYGTNARSYKVRDISFDTKDEAFNYSRYFTGPVKHDSKSDCDFDNEITRDEYLNTHTDYLKTDITIYRDFVIAANNEPLADRPENLIGEENYKRISKHMWAYDWGTYYIRNNEARTDIEVNVCDENYEGSFGPRKPEIETIEREEDDLF